MSSKSFQNASKLNGIVSVLQFGAVGDGTTNDTASFLAAIDFLGASGGSVMIGDGRYLLDTSLTIKKSISIVGPHQFTGTPGNNSSAPYDTMGGALILNSSATITIESGASLTGVLIHRKGMTFPAADSAAYAGTAVTIGGDDASVSSCMILGFNKAVYSSNFSRPKLYDLHIDCQNGIEITLCYDIPRIANVHCWPFATISNTGFPDPAWYQKQHRSGSAFYLHDSVDGPMLSNCFAYGYLNGFKFSNVSTISATNCFADNTTYYTTSAGWNFSGNINGFEPSSCASWSCNNGIVVDINYGQFVAIKNFRMANNTANAVNVISGNCDVINNYITQSTSAVSVSTNQSVVKFDWNTLTTISVSPVFTGASTTNIRIGANNFRIDVPTGTLANGPITSPQVASADPLDIPNLGEVFNVLGTTGFGNLAGGWAGRKVTFIFAGSLTVFNGSGFASSMRLSGGANFSAVAGSTLTLQHNGTQWYEIGRSA